MPVNPLSPLSDSLVASLLNTGNENGARYKLGEFIDHVEAQRGKKIVNDDADALIATAHWIIDNI